MASVVLLGTCDTKLDELLFLRDCIHQVDPDVKIILIDVGRRPVKHDAINIASDTLLRNHPNQVETHTLPRGEVIKTMASCATRAVHDLHSTASIHGIVAAGGSGGTSLASTVMKDALPIGFPKLIVSTVASGDTGFIVGETDITLMYSVVDISGLNELLRTVFRNAAAAIAGMATAYASRRESSVQRVKKRVGITMFGVTTPAVDAIRTYLESNYSIETYVFHATGHGGRAMERLIREGRLDAVLDLTTTELCDHITGGVMSAGPSRLQAAAEAGIPYIVSLGATDMSNFGPKDSVPEKYRNRQLYEHNPMVTLMRTSKDEARQVGMQLTDRLIKYSARPECVQIWLPLGGISMISTPGGPFADAEADAQLFDAVRAGLRVGSIKLVEDERDINNPGFAHDIAGALVELMCLEPTSQRSREE